METIDVRCPEPPNRLFAKFRLGNTLLDPDDYVEFACSDCKRSYRSARPDVVRVLHRFDVRGKLVANVLVTSSHGPLGR